MSLIDRIISAESGGDPNARNPRSSAAGSGQFIDSTWLSMLARHRPDISGSKEDLLARKLDPELSREMTARYAADNAAILAKAGIQATPGSTYLAHFAGPQGAVSVLSADPAAPVASVLDPGAIKANPFLRNMTAGDLRAWADKKVGGQLAPAIMGTAPPKAAPVSLASQIMGAPPPETQAQPMAAPAPAQPVAPAPQYQEPPPLTSMQAPPPVFAAPVLPTDILALLKASGNRGSFFKA